MHIAKVTGALLAFGVALAACGGGSGGSGGVAPAAPIAGPSSPATAPSAAPTSSPTPAPSGTTVTKTGFSGDAKQAQINGKTIFVDATTGLALYFFNGDSTNQSNCTGSCLALWPSHAAATSEKADGNFSIFTRSDGNGMQWAYKGRPLYTFVGDSAANNATGNNVQNFVLATP
jgi:predicted lipoprotein with Yx(FWY)xxD motif